MKKIAVGILGATGLLGQYLLARLHNHPWFEPIFLAGSERSRAMSYKKATSWQIAEPMPECDLTISSSEDIEEAEKRGCRLIFSALPSSEAERLERLYSKNFAVISNAGYARKLPDVPLIVPEVNREQLELIEVQRRRAGQRGFLIAKPNCTVQALILPLAPLDRRFGLKALHVTTLQAISGAGLSGLASIEIHDNVIPYIEGEEEKLVEEPQKILGRAIAISAQCNRVPVLHGHLISIACSFETKPSLSEVAEAWQGFEAPDLLPSTPNPLIYVSDEKRRPQHRLDLERGSGMSVSVGRLQSCPHFDLRFVSLGHNAVRGGSGGSILTAELLYKRGLLSW